MKTIYAIFLDSPSKEAWRKVKEAWPEAHILDDAIAFVSESEPRSTGDVAGEAGIGDEQLGIAIQMVCFNGCVGGALAEWIEQNQQ